MTDRAPGQTPSTQRWTGSRAHSIAARPGLWTGLLLAVFAGCGSSPAPRLFDGEDLDRLRQEAPEAVAAAEAAEADARAATEAGDDAAAGDHTTLARLHLETAEVVSNMARVEAEIATLDAAIQARSETLRALEATHRDLAQQASLADARRVAQATIEAAFAQAAEDEGRRLRRRSEEMAQARMQAARALVDRARVLDASAQALGAEAWAELQDIDLGTDPIVAMTRAEQLHAEALARFGRARTTRGAEALQEGCQHLMTMATERRLVADVSTAGMTFRAVTPRQMGTLAELLSALPPTPVIGQGRTGQQLIRALQRAGYGGPARHVAAGETAIVVPMCAPEAHN